MMLTEKEARKKWCPFVRLLAETKHAWPMNNREIGLKGDGEISRCIASECMAWRTGLLECFEDMDDLGYCGLAGKPEGCRT